MSTTMVTPTQDNRVDARIVLSTSWIAMLFVSAYVDILGSFRADILRAARAGTEARSTTEPDRQHRRQYRVRTQHRRPVHR